MQKRNSTWWPKGKGADYEAEYIAAILARKHDLISTCLSKDTLRNADAAANAARRCSTMSGKTLRFYKCHYCGGYHLTSRPLPQAEAA